MQLGMVGPGKMGANMTQRLLRGGHHLVVYDRNPKAVRRAAEKDAAGVDSLQAVVQELRPPRALAEDQSLARVSPQVADSGEGRRTVPEAIDLNVPAPVATLSLIQRLRSRDTESYADRLLAVLLNQVGGYAIERKP